jgi:hypothetical protein
VALLAPKIVFDNPRVRIKSKMQGPQATVAQSLESAVNRQIRDQDLRKPLLVVTVDAMFRWGVILTTLETDTARGPMDYLQGEMPRKPMARRLSPRRFGWDPQAIDLSESRYYWHKWVEDKDALLERARTAPDEGWNADVIESIAAGAGKDDLHRPEVRDAVERNEIVGYELWIKDHRLEGAPGPEDGFHGTIFTLAYNQSGETGDMIREPRPYYGPPWGPYTVFGIYPVPDETAPLSPTVAVKGSVDMLNAKVRAEHEMDMAYKRIGIISAKDPQLQSAIKKTKNGGIAVANADEIAKNFVQAEIGGATDQIRMAILGERARVSQYAGISDATRGAVSGAGTATENAIADQSSETRIGFIKQQIQDGARQVCSTFAWYDYYEDRILFPLGDEDAAALAQGGAPVEEAQGQPMIAPPEAWYQGGEHQPGSGYCFQDLELDIEPYSMERTSEALQQARLATVLEYLTTTLPVLVQQPYVNVEDVTNVVSNVLNMPDLAKLVNSQGVRMMQMIAVQGLLAPPAPAPEGKVGSQVGAQRPEAAGRPTLQARPSMPAHPFSGSPKPGPAGAKPVKAEKVA